MSKKHKSKNLQGSSISTSASSSPLSSSSIKKIKSTAGFWKENWRQLCIISLLSFGLYIQSVSFDYVLDDSILIVTNKYTQKGIAGIGDIFTTESFKGAFDNQPEMVEGGRYRPLSIATFALEKSLTGGNKAISHLINVLLYVLTGILLYRDLLFMFPKARSGSTSNRWFFTLPFIATVLFIVHPLHVEVVANIKGRDEIFALLGELGLLYCSFKWLAQKKNKFLFFSFLFALFGIFSKENVITFLAVLPITAYFFTRSSLSDKLKITLPLVLATFIYIIMRIYALGYFFTGAEITNIMNNPFYGLSFSDKMATVFYTLLLYLKLLIWPHPLTHDYYPYHIPIMHWSDWASLLSLLLHLLLIVIMIKGWKRKSVLSYSIAFYLVTLSIVSNLVISVGTFMNERFVYHASLGFCIAVGWLLTEKMNFSRLSRIAAKFIFFLATIVYITLSLLRIPDWKSVEALDRSALKVSPDSARANHFFGMLIWGNVYLKLPKDADSARKRAVLDSLKPYFDKALEILPSYNSANAMKAGIAAEYHKLDNDYAKLIKAFEEVNRTMTYEKFILEYLRYINKKVNNRKDAELLAAFYQRMIDFYNRVWKNTTLPSDYTQLLNEIRERMTGMNE
jgi:hypothetical protein